MNKEIQTLKPFTRFLMTIGQLPSSYLVSMTYEEQLLWFCNYLENTVIPTVNNNAEVVEELQTLYTQLKEYVDNYFENLDVQEEINNKLDAMVEDGTLEEIINQEIFGELNEQVSQNTQDISDLTTTVSNNYDTLDGKITINKNAINQINMENSEVYKIKNSNNYNTYKHLVKPIFKNTFNNFNITTNGYKYTASFNEQYQKFKNESTNIWYVAVDGDENNAGTSPSAPRKKIGQLMASSNFQSGDTIILAPGIYERGVVNPLITKSCNIIAEKPNTVFLSNSVWLQSDNLSFTHHDTYTNVYYLEHSGLSNVLGIIDLHDTNNPFELKLVTSVQECNNTPSSYYISGNILYVHLLNNLIPSKINIALNYNWNKGSLTTSNSLSNSIKIYIENLNIIGGTNGGFEINKSTGSNKHEITCVNCKFMFSYNNGGLYNKGSHTILIDCEASYNHIDGFSYHENATGVEYNCVGKYNGTSGNLTNNGTTAHSSNIMRLNGIYYNNMGPNLADTISSNTLNINCTMFDSEIPDDPSMNKSDVRISQSTNAYLLGCNTKYSSSSYNLYNYDDTSNLYVDNSTTYDTTYGTITNYTPIIVNSNPSLHN